MKFKILIVDDEVEIINTLTRYLELDDHYEIESVTDPAKALEKVNKDKIHIVLTDIMMPGMSGIELLEQIKTIDGLTQVIMMTAFSTIDRVVECLEKGANDYILKPFDDLAEVQNIIGVTAAKLERWKEVLVSSRNSEIKQS